jgi:molecular chaperone HtpG
MAEGQEFLYYAVADSAEKAARLPQAERILEKGYEVLYLTDEVDEFVLQVLEEAEGKKFKSVADPDALPESDEEKKELEQRTEESKNVLDFVKETLGERIKEARLSRVLKSGSVCLTADGPLSIEMEKYFSKMEGGGMPMKAEKVLELNGDSPAFAALKKAVEAGDTDKAAKYTNLLYAQALLIADLPLEDTAAYTELVCSLFN